MDPFDGIPPTKKVLDGLSSRYRADERKSFVFTPRAIVALHAINCILEEGAKNENMLHRLVSEVLKEMYLAEEVEFRTKVLPSETTPEDRIYDRLVSESGRLESVKDICDDVGMNRCTVCDRFSRIYVCTPYALQKRDRMLRAASSILLGAASMGTVAESVGYSSESKFAKAFKEEFGCRPKHFKSEFLNDRKVQNRSESSSRPSPAFRDGPRKFKPAKYFNNGSSLADLQ